MTTTPDIWKAQTQANLTDIGDQTDPAILDIGQGRYVVVWTEASNGIIATAPGTDLVGQIFDALGQPVGDAFRVNQHFTGDDEHNATLAARPGGGFIVAYEDTNSDGTSIRVEQFDLNGVNLGFTNIQNDASTDTLGNPSIAVQADGSYLVAYQRSDNAGDTDIVGRVVDKNGTVGDEFVVHDTPHDTLRPDMAALSNGSYVVVSELEFDGSATDLDVWFHIVSAGGTVVTGDFANQRSTHEDDAHVAALSGGGFVVVWADNEGDGAGSPGIRARIYDNDGVPLGDAFLVNTTTGDVQHAPEVTALMDGGFVVVWDDNGASQIKGQRFDKTGAPVGDEFVAGSNLAEADPVVAALSDGRFVTGFTELVGDDDIHATIFDPRGEVIIGTDDPDLITSRQDGGIVDGRKGDDTLLGQDGKDTLKGGKGDDRLHGGDDDDMLKGGKGDDRLRGESGRDTLEGGKGDDLLVGGHVDVATNGDHDTLAGGKGNDTLTGSFGKDKFVFDTKLNADTNVDTVTDFQVGQDTLQLDKDIFSKIGSKLGSGEFRVGSKAKDDNDHIIYNDDNGKLFYDKNGDTSGGKTLFAKLGDDLDLSHKDFDMI